jgi:hypothetical protein
VPVFFETSAKSRTVHRQRRHDPTRDLVLDFELQMVKGLTDGSFRQRCKCAIGFLNVACASHLAQVFTAGSAGRNGIRGDFVQDLALSSPEFLNPIGIAIEYFQHRQRLLECRKFLGHPVGRGQRHESVKPDIVLTAECAGIRQCSGGYQRL